MFMEDKAMLKKEYEYFRNHEKEFIDKYDGKTIVIKDNSVIGVHDNEKEAYFETIKAHKMGTFLIQPVFSDRSGTVHKFHSRVYV